MLPQSLVLVELEDGPVDGLVLRIGKEGNRLLVTYEQGGRIVTTWVPIDRVRLAGSP